MVVGCLRPGYANSRPQNKYVKSVNLPKTTRHTVKTSPPRHSHNGYWTLDRANSYLVFLFSTHCQFLYITLIIIWRSPGHFPNLCFLPIARLNRILESKLIECDSQKSTSSLPASSPDAASLCAPRDPDIQALPSVVDTPISYHNKNTCFGAVWK